jgi:hypothetical protein
MVTSQAVATCDAGVREVNVFQTRFRHFVFVVLAFHDHVLPKACLTKLDRLKNKTLFQFFIETLYSLSNFNHVLFQSFSFQMRNVVAQNKD